MFERWALELLTLSETQLILIGFAFSILGGLAGWLSDKGQSTLLRAPYFAATALIILCIYLAQWLWVFAFGAVQQGLLFLLVSAAFGSFLVAGFFTARIALARSRDAFGKASYAVLAFIPFMNLILIGKPSLQAGTDRQKKIFNQLSGGTGVAVGLLFLVLLGLSKTLLDEKMQELAESNELNSNEKLDVIAENLGVEETLKLVVSTLPLPYKIDENVMLIDLQADGTVLTRTMQITIAGFSAPANFKERILQGLCATQGARDLLRDGAQFHDIYLDSKKNLIAEIEATDADCLALGL